jgi:hypothetical protein
MDPLSLIFSAIVAGAASALKPTADKAITDGYEALKALIKAKWKGVSVKSVELDPASLDHQRVLRDDLQSAGRLDDHEVLAKAQELIQAVNAHDPDAAVAAGISIKDIEAGGSVNIEDLVAAGALTVENVTAGQDFNVKGARAGNPPVR